MTSATAIWNELYLAKEPAADLLEEAAVETKETGADVAA
jgi:hypothetical protein